MTLMEIMLVLILIAASALWSLHSWREHQQSVQLEQQAQRLRLYLTEVQSSAYRHNQTRILWVIDGLDGCVGSYAKPEQCLPAMPGVFQLTAPDISIKAYSEKTMGFYGLRNMAQAGHISLQNQVGVVRVILSARGRLRLCSEKQSMGGIVPC